MSIARLYDKTATIKRLTAYSGSNRTSYRSIAANVACRIDQTDIQASLLGDGAVYAHFKMYCDSATDIRVHDRVQEGTREYTVRAVKPLSFKQRSYTQALLELSQ